MLCPIFMDTSNVKIKILPTPPIASTSNGVATAPVALGVREQQQLLREKYTKLKRK